MISREEIVGKLIQAVKDYLEWGAMTGSDRYFHESKFRKLLSELGVEVRDLGNPVPEKEK